MVDFIYRVVLNTLIHNEQNTCLIANYVSADIPIYWNAIRLSSFAREYQFFIAALQLLEG